MSLNVLIVDDSPVARAIIGKTLTLSGLPLGKMSEAGNGKEALDVLDSNWIDIILADINMPVMNGVELVEALSANGMIATVPVIMVSSDGSQSRTSHLIGMGVKAFVRKPFTPEHMRDTVQRVLGIN